MLATARERDRAPDALRTRIERDRAAARGPARRPWRLIDIGAAVAVLALVAVLAVALAPSGSPGAPTISRAAELSLQGATRPAPASMGTRLGASVSEVYFPDWQATLGWRAVGERTDTLRGHRAVTIYYARGGQQVAYTIVSTPPLSVPSAQSLTVDALTVRVLYEHERTIVTWRRSGATCVLSARGVDARTLARLAVWSAQADTT